MTRDLTEELIEYLRMRKDTCSIEKYAGMVEVVAHISDMSVDDIFNLINKKEN